MISLWRPIKADPKDPPPRATLFTDRGPLNYRFLCRQPLKVFRVRLKFYFPSLLILGRFRIPRRDTQHSPVDANWTRGARIMQRSIGDAGPSFSRGNQSGTLPRRRTVRRRFHCLIDGAGWIEETRLICGYTWLTHPISVSRTIDLIARTDFGRRLIVASKVYFLVWT